MEIRPILSTLRRHKVTAWLLVLEIALTCAIVCNAVFLIDQRLERMNMPSGIAEHELVQIQMTYIGNRPDAAARAATDLAALRQIPGVRAVTLANELPFGGSSWNSGIALGPNQRHATVEATQYFGENLIKTLGVRLIAGRGFHADEYIDYGQLAQALSSGDAKGMPHVVMITHALAARLWPGSNPLGKQIYLGSSSPPFTVIGVVARLVRPARLENGPEYSTIWPVRMTMTQGASYLIRCAPQDRERVLRAALARLKTLDPNRVVLMKGTWDEVRGKFFASDRAMAGMLVGVIVALLLVTALGIVGLASFWVAQRRRMIGVRRALGARRLDILRYFQTENLILSTAGIALGCAAAIGINLWLMTHYEVPRLPLLYLPIGALTLWTLGQIAVLGPALRAAAVPPAIAVRSA